MMIKCPDGRLINMDLVMDVEVSGTMVVFERVFGSVCLPCQSEDEARETVDLIFRCRASRLDLSKE